MAKKKINKQHKQDLLEIVKKIILTRHPELDDVKFMEQKAKELEKELQIYIKSILAMPEDVYTYLASNNYFEQQTRYISVDSYTNIDPKKGEQITKQYKISLNCYMSNQYYRNFLYTTKTGIMKDSPLYSIISECIFDFNEECKIQIKQKEKQYKEIYDNFFKIISSLKYLENVLDYMDDDDIKSYVENQLRIECTTLTTINPQNIDFVKNFLAQRDKKVVDKEKD